MSGILKNNYIMAIIRSLAVGKARKSAGNVTYRTVRGRTILSEKVGPRAEGGATRLPNEGLLQNRTLSIISQYMRIHSTDIEVSFNRTRYGSRRNYYMKLNYPVFRDMVSGYAIEEGMSDSELDAAVGEWAAANQNRLLRVSLQGFDRVYQNGVWSSDDNPVSGGATNDIAVGQLSTTVGANVMTAPIAATQEFASGARIVRGAGRVNMRISTLPAGVKASQITYLGAGGAPISQPITVTVSSSTSGNLVFDAPELTEAMYIVGFRIGQTYYRLTSAYVRDNTEAPDPGA